jgi:hypothetical protein
LELSHNFEETLLNLAVQLPFVLPKLDNVAKEWPVCLRTITAVSILTTEAQNLVLEKPLTVYTPMIWEAF